jgi:hypothetical protein
MAGKSKVAIKNAFLLKSVTKLFFKLKSLLTLLNYESSEAFTLKLQFCCVV